MFPTQKNLFVLVLHITVIITIETFGGKFFELKMTGLLFWTFVHQSIA